MRLQLAASLLPTLLSVACLATPEVANDRGTQAVGSSNTLYDSERFEVSTESYDITYEADHAPERTVHVQARLSDAPGERPVVVVSHGGSDGQTKPEEVLVDWSELFASHGYHVLTIAHPARSPEEEEALCESFELPEGPDCTVAHAWDRPYDVEQVLDFLEDQAAGPWADRVDLGNIAMLGHSAGASGTLVVAGATRQLGVRTLNHHDERVTVAIAASPGGVADNGFEEDSWQGIDIPVLVLSGRDDVTHDAQPETYRLDAFHGMPETPGNRMLFLDAAGTKHGLFGLNPKPCNALNHEDACMEMIDAIESTALAHLDTYLSADPIAASWLEDEVVEDVVTPGVAILDARCDIILR